MSSVDLSADVAAAATETLTQLRKAEWQNGFNRADWDVARDAGWLDILRREEDGGLGLGLAEMGAVFRAVGRHLFAGPLLEHAVALPLVEQAGARVEGMVAIVDRRSRTVRFADCADTLLVLGNGGVSVVPTARATVKPRESLDPSVTYADVSLDGAEPTDRVSLDVERLLGSLRLMIAFELTGIADRALELSIAYAKQREQFGRPIGSFQAVQHLLAEMARRRHVLDALCSSAGAATPEALPLAGRVTKAAAAANARKIVEGSMQVHGGIAFTTEHVLHRYYKHLLGLEQLLGGPRELATDLGQMLLRADADPWPSW